MRTALQSHRTFLLDSIPNLGVDDLNLHQHYHPFPTNPLAAESRPSTCAATRLPSIACALCGRSGTGPSTTSNLQAPLGRVVKTTCLKPHALSIPPARGLGFGRKEDLDSTLADLRIFAPEKTLSTAVACRLQDPICGVGFQLSREPLSRFHHNSTPTPSIRSL